MSSGSTTSIVVLSATAGSSGGSDDDDVECRTCYGVVVACLSLFLFCVLAATAGVVKASAVTGLTVVFFGIIGWLVPGSATGTATGRDAMGAWRATHHDARARASRVVMALRAGGYSCPPGGAATIDVPPAFAYECPSDAESSGKSAGSALCAVCLEDVRQGETVRRLPACGHLFHKDCIDMWLHSHTTCPLCRCDLSPRRRAMKTTAAVAAQSAVGALPPV